MILEAKFQHKVIQEIQRQYPGAVILKNDPNYLQGFPDLTILYYNSWAVLETKRSAGSRYRPNQGYYINLLNDMCFASAINPQNKDEVFDGIQRTFST